MYIYVNDKDFAQKRPSLRLEDYLNTFLEILLNSN